MAVKKGAGTSMACGKMESGAWVLPESADRMSVAVLLLILLESEELTGFGLRIFERFERTAFENRDIGGS